MCQNIHHTSCRLDRHSRLSTYLSTIFKSLQSYQIVYYYMQIQYTFYYLFLHTHVFMLLSISFTDHTYPVRERSNCRKQGSEEVGSLFLLIYFSMNFIALLFTIISMYKNVNHKADHVNALSHWCLCCSAVIYS